MLEYSDSNNNELIVVNSTSGGDSANLSNNFLGYDIYCNGYGSMIREGIFADNAKFGSFRDSLNQYGLFSSLEGVNNFIDAHMALLSLSLGDEFFEGEIITLPLYKCKKN